MVARETSGWAELIMLITSNDRETQKQRRFDEFNVECSTKSVKLYGVHKLSEVG